MLIVTSTWRALLKSFPRHFISMSRYVIYDCDMGNDDAWGLLMLIKAEEALKQRRLKGITPLSKTHPFGFQILGVSCVHGNTDVDNVVKNTLRLLDASGRTDIPVYKGCAKPLLPPLWKRTHYFHGKDGFGDLKHEREMDLSLLQREHAVNAFYKLVCQYPKMIDFLLVGSLTNFAVCINMYGNDFLDKLGNVYVMGGNMNGKGNVQKCAEFNFYSDPEAAYIVLENIKKPLVILPWETCIDGDFDVTFSWRMEVLSMGDNPALELMNRIDNAIFTPKNFLNWIVCDAILVAAYLFPQAVARSRGYHATVELTGRHTRGQMVLDHLRQNVESAIIIKEIHKGHWRSSIAWTAGVKGFSVDELF